MHQEVERDAEIAGTGLYGTGFVPVFFLYGGERSGRDQGVYAEEVSFLRKRAPADGAVRAERSDAVQGQVRGAV